MSAVETTFQWGNEEMGESIEQTAQDVLLPLYVARDELPGLDDGAGAFIVWARPAKEDWGYLPGERFWVLKVTHDPDMSAEDRAVLERTALDLTRMRYGWTE